MSVSTRDKRLEFESWAITQGIDVDGENGFHYRLSTRQAWKAWLEGYKFASRRLYRNQECGCIVCICESDEQCQGCGAKSCGTHPVGEIPNPVFDDE